MALASFGIYAESQHWFGSPWLQFVSNVMPWYILMPFGPLIYFYIRTFAEPGFKITSKYRLHFLPLLIDLIVPLTAWIFVIGVLFGIIINNQKPWGIFIDTYNVYSDIPRWLSITVYLFISAKYIAGLKVKSNTGFKWMRQFINLFLAFQLVWLIYLIPYVIPQYTDLVLGFSWYPVYIPLSVLIYWLGIKGYIIQYKHDIDLKKTNGNTLDNETIDQALILLDKAMFEDNVYLNPDLNLNMLSNHTGLAQKTISYVLNQNLKKNFNEYVNHHRVEAFKKRILQADMAHLTIAGVAFECGFTSQSTFQRAFKQITGLTPSEFLKSISSSYSIDISSQIRI